MGYFCVFRNFRNFRKIAKSQKQTKLLPHVKGMVLVSKIKTPVNANDIFIKFL